jgi:hypothetical protein
MDANNHELSADSGTCRLANFVIGGTEKAGTTSVFDYLSAHPQVCTSLRKETDFFRNGYTGNPEVDVRRYGSYFERCDSRVRIVAEASPGYLGEAATVAPRMRALVPGVKILFILRDPAERLYSSFNFHRGKLDLPQDMSFDAFLRCCEDFQSGTRTAQQCGIDEWYLRMLRFGCYADLIAVFRSQFPSTNLKVMFFEELGSGEQAFMTELSDFLGIDSAFWSDFEFGRSNVTFAGRNRTLHRLAMRINTMSEPLMRRYPRLKKLLVRTYKTVNQEREGYDPMSAATKSRLIDFYTPSVRELQHQLDQPLPESWQYLVHGPVLT